MPGIFMQVIAMSATVAAAEAAEDMAKGIIDRFKSHADRPLVRPARPPLADLSLRMFGLA